MRTTPDFDALEPWELAVRLTVQLWYPGAKRERRERIANAIGRQMLDVTFEHGRMICSQGYAAFQRDLAERFPNYTAAAGRNASTRFIYRHEQALRVGMMILPLISYAAIGEYPAITGRLHQPSIVQTVRELVPASVDPGDADQLRQFQKAEIRPWYPVAHLAAAFALASKERERAGQAMTFDYHDEQFFARVLALADDTARHLRATEATHTIANRLLPLTEFDRLRMKSPLA